MGNDPKDLEPFRKPESRAKLYERLIKEALGVLAPDVGKVLRRAVRIVTLGRVRTATFAISFLVGMALTAGLLLMFGTAVFSPWMSLGALFFGGYLSALTVGTVLEQSGLVSTPEFEEMKLASDVRDMKYAASAAHIEQMKSRGASQKEIAETVGSEDDKAYKDLLRAVEKTARAGASTRKKRAKSASGPAPSKVVQGNAGDAARPLALPPENNDKPPMV